MTKEEFKRKNGYEPQMVEENYSTKSLAPNYNIEDVFTELVDNALDARLDDDTPVNISFNIDDDKHEVYVNDDAGGCDSDKKLITLGGTTKEHDSKKIGKYGIGVPGALAAMAKMCRYDASKEVEVTMISKRNERKFEKPIAYYPDGSLIPGKAKYSDCDKSEHGLNYVITNVTIKDPASIMDRLEETFEEPLRKNLVNIAFGSRQLGKSKRPTFHGDEAIKEVKVGNQIVEVKYRILGDDASSNDRAFDETALRVYDKKTGRLLAKDTKLWKWYVSKEAQQNICGLRTGIYIDSSLESYNKFGILPAKNGIKYKLYYQDPDFKELSEVLNEIYKKAVKAGPSRVTPEIKYDGRIFQPIQMKKPEKKDLYSAVGGQGNYVFKTKMTDEEVAYIINENISLKNKLERKESKSKK